MTRAVAAAWLVTLMLSWSVAARDLSPAPAGSPDGASLSAGGNWSNSGGGAVPRLVRFSGTVRDVAAKPLRGPVDVTFSLYREEAGGEALWFETQTVEADALGRYSVPVLPALTVLAAFGLDTLATMALRRR